VIVVSRAWVVWGCSEMLHAVFGEGLELCTAINPDEAVAEGAAIRYASCEVSSTCV
jgi:molecular chaperone DnaK (HSP70)